MARDEAPPFDRGQTWYQGGTIDATNLGGLNLEGMEYEFEDVDYGAAGVGAKVARTGRKVRCRIVRNVAAIALLPKRLVKPKINGTDGRYMVGRVDGYTRLNADGPAFAVDEFLPAAGVPVNDLFWAVVKGPATLLTDLAGAANDVINVGDLLTSLTAATSGATTAGRVKPQDLTGATANLGNEVQNRLGYALSAATTANTNADVLVDLIGRY